MRVHWLDVATLHEPNGLRDLALAVLSLCLSLATLAGVPSEPPAADAAVVSVPTAPLRFHDPSTVLRCREQYWVFATGPGVVSRYSTNLMHWTKGPPVMTAPPTWVATAVPGHRGSFWAPDIIQSGGRYLLYYSVSTWGKNTSAIGLASNATLDPEDPKFQWKDEGIVLQSRATNDFNAIDPALCRDHEGRLWMAFGSFWSGIKLVELDPATGRRRDPPGPVHALAAYPEIEAPCLVEHDGYYYLFVNWGLCCRGVDSTYRILVGRSRHITGPYLDREDHDLRQGGGTLFLDTEDLFVGPGHAAVLQDGERSWLTYHFYDASRRGAPTLAVRRLDWDADGWPAAGELWTPPLSPE